MTSTSGALAVRGATLIDGTGRAPLPDATVVIEGERLVAVGPSATTPIPPGVQTIDGQGNSLVTSTIFYRVNENWGLRASHHFETRDGW